MKKLLLVVAVCISHILYSQSITKMDGYLAGKHQAYLDKGADEKVMLPILIKGNISTIKQLVQKNGGVFKYSYGNLASIVIPVSALPEFNESGAVVRMEGASHYMHILNDSMRAKNHIQEVLEGQSPLSHAYNGKGVVIGFIDAGIDYLHPDFRDSSGTRIKYYWDQNRYINQYTPSQYGYGQAWDKAQIDAAVGNLAQSMDSASIIDYGHGTAVAGSACGNGRCNGHQMGGCPKADIIFVAYNFDVQGPTMFTDAVDYIYRCADSLKEPCVINASLGSYDGSHDDSDLQGEMVDSIILARQPGRVFVAAAGNAGTPFHVHDSLTGSGDTTFTWFMYDGGIGIVDIPIFANCNDFKQVKFKLTVDKVQTGSYIRRDTITVYSDISHYMGTIRKSIYNSHGQRLGVVTSYGELYAKGSYSLEFTIQPDSTSYYWEFESTGTGRFDSWDYGFINGVVDTNGLAINSTIHPGIKKYKQPDTLMTICSSYQCSPHVITAQTYFNRKGFINCLGSEVINANPKDNPGGFVWTTSRGPTRNFTFMKPDIAASGNYTISDIPTWLTSCSSGTDSLGCHGAAGGTSQATPMVSAAAALYLNEYLSASNYDVWHCLTQTAYLDNFTGNGHFPNYNWGYGKLNAFAALTQCAPLGIPVVYSPLNPYKISAFPNPYSTTTIIRYDFSDIKNFTAASIVVYDMFGKVVKTINLKTNQGTIPLNRTNLTSGMYFYSLVVDGAKLKTEKLEVM